MHATAARRRFDKSLDLVAARPELFVDLVSSPSSTDNAWSMLESPFLGRDVVQAPRTPIEEPECSPLAPAPVRVHAIGYHYISKPSQFDSGNPSCAAKHQEDAQKRLVEWYPPGAPEDALAATHTQVGAHPTDLAHIHGRAGRDGKRVSLHTHC